MAPVTATPASAEGLRSIAEVEGETRVPRATLRMWERRYGFPAPARDARGERAYPPAQVELLKQAQLLIVQGHRPASLLGGGGAGIARLMDSTPRAQAPSRTRAQDKVLRLLQGHDVAALRAALEENLRAVGVAAFATEVLPQLSRVIGDAWAAGELQVHEEHLYSDTVYEVLRAAIAGLSTALRPEAPQVLLTTFPQEYHGLGLQMAQALFALQGCRTVMLGVRLPLDQIAAAVRAYRADLVGLSFTPAMNASLVQRGLEELRGMLPTTVRIWAGGQSPAFAKRDIPGVRVVRDAAAIPDLLAEDFALPPRKS
jgi:DNA-binding transcriptional MerR regulator/methylmalonyl-CoA mutase cobalamin-binding subunit